jgi:hypothetical protein
MLAQFLQVTLEAVNEQVIGFGIVICDSFARFTWVEDWDYAARKAVDLLEKWSEKLGDQLIALISTLSAFPSCLRHMKQRRVCEYFAQLQTDPKYIEQARFFFENVSRL